MKELQELVYILSLNKTKKIRQYGFLQDETGRLKTFYEGLTKEKWGTDEQAAQALLNVSSKHKTYRRLKNKLKEELLNAFLFLDTEDKSYSDLQKAYYNCSKGWIQAGLLKAQSAKKTSTQLAKQILKKAIEYDFTILVIDLARQLRITNASYHGNDKEHLYYTSLIETYSNILSLELQAEAIYTNITRHYAKSKSTKNQLFDLHINDYLKLLPHFGQIDSYLFHGYGYLAAINIYMSNNDFQTTARICREAIEYFDTRTYNHKTARLVFLYQLTVCSMPLSNYDEGQRAIEKCYLLSSKGKHYWFRTLENHLLLSLYTKEYDKALEILQTAKKSKGFRHLLESVKERWILHEAYVHFLLSTGQIKKQDKSIKKFRLSKFLNEVPSFQKDKRGMNIPVLILQVLFLWNQKKWDDAYARIEALLKYNYRYLKQEDTFRSSCFIKMLEVAAKHGFQPKITEKKAKPIFDKMVKQDIVFANQSAEIEYIPYNHLWEFSLESLRKVNP